ncbi:FecR family protein [Chitinophaga rupis]|uniref:FecR family protein n=1 Tax=Chitinophaga rupis TaxID=573321 RepID=A0A1H8B1C7_9BACT|nr:FecR family protein [Chitinophaga rupis]SEM75627.1 FecR family protein [Chitinophaga rupis]
MTKEDFLRLVDKYLKGQATAEEEQLLARFYNSFELDDTVVRQELEEKMLTRLMQSVQPAPVKIKRVRSWQYAAAAVILCLLASGALYYQYAGRQAITPAPSLAKQPATPGNNKALLQLADGSTIELNQASNGVLAMQGSTAVKKTKDGQLIYEPAQASATALGSLNTITTPAGGQYQLTLPDGTRVWLNAGSSLTFPTAFDSAGRRITLRGEAYFEVAKVYTQSHNRLPFYVKTGENEVAVLGTHFNVKDYADATGFEATLLEGAVQVKRGSLVQALTPGQQASIRPHSAVIKVRPANTEAVMAWKEGLFLFDNTGIDEAMEEIKRWYNVDVVYEGRKPDIEFTGVLPRSSSVTEVLNLLESAQGVAFELRNNTIIVKQQ